MKPSVDAYTVAMPWYEREDFHELWALAHDRDEMPTDYDVWHSSAVSVMNAWLAEGRALQIVTIKPAPFLSWLGARGLANTAGNRLRYVEDLATRDHDAA
ncbi:hypothetical protein ASE63_11735 [Bosea sp. Root381]|uniref:hypothetical protein n=1 Tax=Bosea sp. Root381 TaxID=1736524 RepID=UPI0006FF04D5|nr:hypothetical protein [Bosea sp. Root381]KRD96090.1 hypothetical protein ASE63_11735 [Bosea sp. Root381]